MARTSFVDVALRLRGARRFNAEVAAATKQLDAMGIRGATSLGAFAQSADRFKSVGRSLTMGVTLPVVGASAAAIKLAMDYNASFAKIDRLVGVNEKQLEGWRDGVLTISDQTGQSAESLGDALYFISSAGFRGQGALDALTASAKASAAGLGETKAIADAVTSAVNSYGPSVLSAARATDIMIKAVAEGKMEADALPGVLGKVTPIAEAMGVSFDQATGAMAVMTRLGAPMTQAATQMSGVLMTFAKPTASMEDALSRVGLSIQGVRDQIRDRGLIPVLEMLRDRTAKAGIDLSEVFSNKRALNGVQMLTKNMRMTDEVMASVANSSGALDTAFAKLTKGQRFQLMNAINQLRNELIRFGSEIGPIIVPQITRFLGVIGSIGKFLSGLPTPIKRVVFGFIAFAAILGPLVWMVGVFAKGIGGLLIVIPRLISAYYGLSSALLILKFNLLSTIAANGGLIGSMKAAAGFMAGRMVAAVKAVTVALRAMALAALANPWVLLAVGIAALIAGLVVAYHKVGWFRNAVDSLFGFIKDNWEIILTLLTGGLAVAVIKIIQNWGKIKAAVSGAVRFILNFLKKNWKTIVAILTGPTGVAVRFLIANFGKIRSAASAVVNSVKTRFESMISFFRGLPGKIASAVSGAFNGIKDAFRSAINFIIAGWNSLDLSLTIPIANKTVSIGTPNIPELATGGTVTRSGLTTVGERGPELLSLPRGASVIPLSRTVANNAVGPQRIEVPVYLNGRQIALAVADEVSNARARA